MTCHNGLLLTAKLCSSGIVSFFVSVFQWLVSVLSMQCEIELHCVIIEFCDEDFICLPFSFTVTQYVLCGQFFKQK
jgi:hypothetical protein